MVAPGLERHKDSLYLVHPEHHTGKAKQFSHTLFYRQS